MSSRQWNWFFVDRIINRCGDCGRQPASEEEDDKSWRCWGKILYFNSKNMVIIWKIFPKPCIKLHGKNLRRKNEKIFDNLRELKNQKAFQWKRNYAQTSIMENHFETVIINTGDKYKNTLRPMWICPAGWITRSGLVRWKAKAAWEYVCYPKVLLYML